MEYVPEYIEFNIQPAMEAPLKMTCLRFFSAFSSFGSDDCTVQRFQYER